MTNKKREPPANEKPRSDSRGFAIVLVLLLTATMTVLGVSFLLMAETENRIAESERLSAQALYVAEAGTRMITRWFDRPMSATNLINPGLAILDRTQRMIDADGDPGTAAVAADGTSTKPYYKQGVDLDADGNDDVFRKPYRDGLLDTLLGTESGPDMCIDETASTTAKTFLRDFSEALFGAYPSATKSLRARITRIDIYAPPYVESGGIWTRYGMGTVKVTSRIYKELPGGTEQVLAERMVKVVLNEIPYNPGELGALHSCGNLTWNGEFSVHWGVTTAGATAQLASNHGKLGASLPRVVSPSTGVDLLWGWDNDANFQAYKDMIEAEALKIDDPWLRLIAGGPLTSPANGGAQQPWPFVWTPGDTLIQDGTYPFHSGPPNPDPISDSTWDASHSNILQTTAVACPVMDYAQWKSVALSGGPGVHYYTWYTGDSFKENGKGAAQTFRDITDNQTGLFFFDTTDRLAPHDDDADGVFDNLTPTIKVSGGTWSTRGVFYLNTLNLEITGVSGRPVVFRAPGEPYQDRNANGRWDTGELYINLDYMTKLDGASGAPAAFRADPTNALQNDGSTGGLVMRNTRGPLITDDANVWGIVYNNGYYDATGNGVFYGTFITYQGIGEFGPSAGTPNHYWDAGLADNWPDDDWGLPRIAVSRWETDM